MALPDQRRRRLRALVHRPPHAAPAIQAAGRDSGTPVTCIGTIRQEPGLTWWRQQDERLPDLGLRLRSLRPAETGPCTEEPRFHAHQSSGPARTFFPADLSEAGRIAPPPTRLRRASSRFMWADPAHVVAMGFGSGLSPVAPGTVGTLWGWGSWVLLTLVLQDHALGLLCLAAFPGDGGPAPGRPATWASPTLRRGLGTRSPRSG